MMNILKNQHVFIMVLGAILVQGASILDVVALSLARSEASSEHIIIWNYMINTISACYYLERCNAITS